MVLKRSYHRGISDDLSLSNTAVSGYWGTQPHAGIDKNQHTGTHVGYNDEHRSTQLQCTETLLRNYTKTKKY